MMLCVRAAAIGTLRCEFRGISYKNISIGNSTKLASTPELHCTVRLPKLVPCRKLGRADFGRVEIDRVDLFKRYSPIFVRPAPDCGRGQEQGSGRQPPRPVPHSERRAPAR